MEFRIADTFTDSLSRLTAQEQKAAKTTAFDLQLNPSSPGLSFHKLDRAKDSNFWSVRVNADIRLIVRAIAVGDAARRLQFVGAFIVLTPNQRAAGCRWLGAVGVLDTTLGDGKLGLLGLTISSDEYKSLAQ
jgi:mRNA-degrading endonuclease RelE of RelBE toxin-antitoxin system